MPDETTEIITCPDCCARYVVSKEKLEGKKFGCDKCLKKTGEIKVLRDYTGSGKSKDSTTN